MLINAVSLQALIVPDKFQHILRVLNTNIDGRHKIMFGLTAIKVRAEFRTTVWDREVGRGGHIGVVCCEVYVAKMTVYGAVGVSGVTLHFCQCVGSW